MSALKPLLKHSNAINGIMAVEISNYSEFYRENHDIVHEFSLRYKFSFQTDNKYYQNNTWKSTSYITLGLSRDINKYFIKLPLFLLSYSLEYQLLIKQFILNENEKWEYCGCYTSDIYTANIPSILIESKHEIGDHIQFNVPNTAMSRYGIIMEFISKDSTIKIKTDPIYHSLNYRAEVITVPSSKVFRFPARGKYIVDITQIHEAQIHLILRVKNEIKKSMYIALCNAICTFLFDEMEAIEKDEYNFIFMSASLAINICQFLYVPQYNYRINCMLDAGCLYVGDAWKDDIGRNFGHNVGEKYSVSEFQLTRYGLGYSCDLCRSEISWYQFVFSCQGNLDHVFCLLCIHSIIMQYDEMKPFLSGLLKDVLNDCCIEEIVAFIVGKVIKFENANKMEEIQDIDGDIMLFEGIDKNQSCI